MACLFLTSFAFAQQPLNTSLVVPGDAKPISITTDNLTTWQEGTTRILMLRGKVLIEQGTNAVRSSDMVIWVDEKTRQESGVFMVDVYSEGETNLARGPQPESGLGALLKMSTRGEIRMKSYVTAAQTKDLSSDPLYRKAKQARSAQPSTAKVDAKPAPFAPPAAAPPPIMQTSGTTPTPFAAPPLPPSGPSAINTPPPMLPPELRNSAEPLRPVSSATGPIQPVQAVTPVPGVPGPTDVPPPPIQFPQPGPPATAGPGPVPSPGNADLRKLIIRPRSSQDIQARNFPLPSGETAVVVTTGVILSVQDPANPQGNLDIEADRLVFWTKENPQKLFGNMTSPGGDQSKQMEFFLSGHVEIRSKSGVEQVTLRADHVYYDVGRSVAIAIQGDIEIQDPKSPYPVHMRADELLQLNAKVWTADNAVIYSSILPSDPQLRVEVRQMRLTDSDQPRRSIFGRTIVERNTGAPKQEKLILFEGQQNYVYIGQVPVLYFPWLRTNSKRPFGPLEGLDFGYNQVFGFQVYTKWDLFELFGTTAPDGVSSKVFLDYLDRRGPAIGNRTDYAGEDAFGVPNKYSGTLKAYGIYDQAYDILGGDRGRVVYVTPTTTEGIHHPDPRGRINWRNRVDDLPNGFSVLSQVAFISDRNFLEQYFYNEWINDINQETFVQVKQQDENRAWTLLAQPRVRSWINETEWYPKADAYLIGQDLFDRFTFTSRNSAGAGRTRTVNDPPFSYFPTDVRAASGGSPTIGRFDTWNELSLPFNVGDVRIVPYLRGDAAYYTDNNAGNDVGRLYGAAGVRASMPLSKFYPTPYSELFNVDTLYHKILLSANYYVAGTNVGYDQLPQMDRLNDDASDQSLRNMQTWQLKYIDPATANLLLKKPLFDPQNYAVRRLVDTRVDTLDDINVAQFGIRQRLQTKRGFPGDEHVIDWMMLDLRVSVFPQGQTQNFGEHWGIFEYDYVWNIGDRTALLTRGLVDPFPDGPRVFNVAGQYQRPDGTLFTLGYRTIDPIESRAVIAQVAYQFSPKYYVTGSGVWDIGLQQNFYSFGVTRIGTDLQVTLGFSYNSTINNFGVNFSIIPNLARPEPGTAFLNNNNNANQRR